MTYALFLDDNRNPPDASWIVVRCYADAVQFVKDFGMPNRVSFDHDLGETATGLHFAHFLIAHHLDGTPLPDDFSFTVHSRNPVGAENITALMARFLQYIREPLAELSTVTAIHDTATPDGVLPAGSHGTIVHVYPDAVAYEVEFEAPWYVVTMLRSDFKAT